MTFLTPEELSLGAATQDREWLVGDSTDNSTKAEPHRVGLARTTGGAPDHLPISPEGGYCR